MCCTYPNLCIVCNLFVKENPFYIAKLEIYKSGTNRKAKFKKYRIAVVSGSWSHRW